MAEIYRMPDLPIDYIRYLDDDPDYIILFEKYFIKRIRNKSHNIHVLCDIADLEIEGFNNHKRVFLDDCEESIYLNAPYLKDHTDMVESLQKMILQEILKSFKYLFTNLHSAHENEFNPFDVKFSNYLMSPEGIPIFIDFDFSFYQGRFTFADNTQTTIFQLNEFVKDINLKDIKVLNLNDKMLALKMLFKSLSNIYVCKYTSDIDLLRNTYNIFKSKYIIDPKIDEYIQSILYEYNPPKEDDYFIDTIIDPFLDGGLILKKTSN